MQDRHPENNHKPHPTPPTVTDETVIDEIRKAISAVRFGTIQLIVQDGRVVQIEKTEKIRLV
jgi:hypothetical protein